MRTKELAFKLEDSDNVIFGTYVYSSDKIYFKRLCDNKHIDNVKDIFDNYIELDNNNVLEFNELVENIQNDNTILDKIKSNPSEKLLFQYPKSEKLISKLEAF